MKKNSQISLMGHLLRGGLLLVFIFSITFLAVPTVQAEETHSQSIPNNGGSATIHDVTITNWSTNTCTFTVTKYLVPPGGNPAGKGEMPIQWKITTDGTCGSISVNLVFHYTNGELSQGNNVLESNLRVYRNTGGTNWTSVISSVDIDTNEVTANAIHSLSSWTIADTISIGNGYPSPVELQSTAAHTGSRITDLALLIGVGVLLVGGGVLLRRRQSQG